MSQPCSKARVEIRSPQPALDEEEIQAKDHPEDDRSEERRVGKESRIRSWPRDWSSDVCSSDLEAGARVFVWAPPTAADVSHIATNKFRKPERMTDEHVTAMLEGKGRNPVTAASP